MARKLSEAHRKAISEGLQKYWRGVARRAAKAGKTRRKAVRPGTRTKRKKRTPRSQRK